MATSTRPAPSLPILAAAGALVGVIAVAALTLLGVGPYGDSAGASEGSAMFTAVPTSGGDGPIAAPATSAPTTSAPSSTTTEPDDGEPTTTTSTTTPAPETTDVPTTTVPDTTTTAPAVTTPPPTTPPTTPPVISEPPTTTVPPPPATEPAYLASLSSSTIDQGPGWVAVVTLRIRNSDGVNTGGATVSGVWSTGSEAGSCTTDGSGSCTVFQSTLTDANPSTTFTVTGASATGYVYAGALTGASQITVTQP